MSQTVIQAFESMVEQRGDKPALKTKRSGEWKTITWAQYRDNVMRTARGLMALGLKAGDAISIIGFNCPEWIYADLGAIAAGGVPAGIYTTSSPEQCQYVTDHSESVVVVVENAEHLAKFKQVRDRLPGVKAFVLMFGSDSAEDVFSWSDLMELADTVPESELRGRIEAQKPEDCATLIYTSGTTGKPKAVMLDHTALVWTGRQGADNIQFQAGDNIISYLPLCHIAEQNISIHCAVASGGTVWFAESLEQMPENLREVKPASFLGVPRVWEKVQAKIQNALEEATGLRRWLVDWARSVGLAAAEAEDQGRSRPFLYPLADKLIFSKVKAQLGLEKARYFASGAAPISRDTLDFFASLGMRIYELYGQSESTGAGTINLPGGVRTGSIGKAWPGTEVKIADDGEILLHGPHVFMGYLKNEEATRDTLTEDGWLKTGDVGKMDEDGFVYITDRKKELIITRGGENISPAHVEGELKAIPVVNQVVVIGDQRRYLTALFTLDPEAIPSAAKKAGSDARSLEEAANDPKFQEYFAKQVEEVNSKLARVQTIKKWTILPEEFSVDGGELTPTMKLKRRVVNDKYADEIEALYED